MVLLYLKEILQVCIVITHTVRCAGMNLSEYSLCPETCLKFRSLPDSSASVKAE